MRNLMLITTVAFLLGGCTLVKLTRGGENVAILQASEVGGCTADGNVTVTVPNKLLVNRETARIAQDLRTLARNRAAERGVDTLVATSEPRNGEQTFDYYRCRR